MLDILPFFNRDTMPVYPTEASWILSTSTSPDPLYQDKNLTVYGIPISPSLESSQIASASSTDPSTVDQSLDHSLKRKREASPESPSKRPALMAEESGLLKKTPSLGDIIHRADFSPVGLTGETAQEWRRLMIDTMFPDVKEKMDTKKQNHRKERYRDSVPSPSKKFNDKGAGSSVPNSEHSKSTAETNTSDTKGPTPLNGKDGSAESNVSSQVSERYDTQNPKPFYIQIDIYKRARLPPGFHKQLPKYDSPSASASSSRPTLAYIAVGPRVRGKFDVKKADELGVPFGPERGKLTKGESVTVKVKVNGQFVERVVQPEECVGENETPVVSDCYIEYLSYLIETFIFTGRLGSGYSNKSAYPFSVIRLRYFPFLCKIPLNQTRRPRSVCRAVRLPHLWRWSL